MKFKDTIEQLISGKISPMSDIWNISERELESIGEFGFGFTHFHDLTSDQIQKRFDETRDWMKFVDSSRMNSVYLDTTTLYTIEKTVLEQEGKYLNPATLIDISSFINCVVLYDHIFHLENQYIDQFKLNEALGNEPIVIYLPVESLSGSKHGDSLHSFGSALRSIWHETVNNVEELNTQSASSVFFQDAEVIKKAWRQLFNFDVDIFDNSILTSWESDGPNLLEALVDATDLWLHECLLLEETYIKFVGNEEKFSMDLSEFISECNYRCLFNQVVGYFLKLHYIPNSFRMPFRNSLYFKKARSVLSYIEDEYENLAELYFAPTKNNLVLPFFPSAIFSKISSLNEFFEVLIETRRKASKFRQHRAELDEAIQNGNAKVAARLRKAIREDSKKLRSIFLYVPIAAAIGAVLPRLGSATTPTILITLAILTFAYRYPSDLVEKLKERVLSPEYWFLIDLKESAAALTDAYNKICTLWGLKKNNKENFSNIFTKFSKLRH